MGANKKPPEFPQCHSHNPIDRPKVGQTPLTSTVTAQAAC